MEASFWHERWEQNRIGFHEMQAHPLLVRYFPEVAPGAGGRVFVPLCGKTLDIGWLRAQGFGVVAAELSPLAVAQLFAENGLEPEVSDLGGVVHYRAAGLDVFCGDIFAVTREMVGRVDAVYDRAALVALPEAMRGRYTEHVAEISGLAPQLLISFDYDQRAMAGPPFAVPGDAVRRLYGGRYRVEQAASVPLEGGLKGKCAANEDVWVLRGV